MRGDGAATTLEDATLGAVAVVAMVEVVAEVVAVDDTEFVDVDGDTDRAPTAADFRTAMTDSKREPAGPTPPDGVLGVTGGRGAADGSEEGAPPFEVLREMVVVGVALELDFDDDGVVARLATTALGMTKAVALDSPTSRGSSFTLTNSLTPEMKSSFCLEEGDGTLGCLAI